MNGNLERRVEALEAKTTAPNDHLVWIVRGIAVGRLQPDNNFCRLGEVVHVREASESSVAFEERMLALAREVACTERRPTFIVMSESALHDGSLLARQ
jgi:hypothetical protein